jgi:2-keto-4-pentenoate hydratase/2-oxohepta-3-ene-1,7-dioic acid hydratase in catechol pathway
MKLIRFGEIGDEKPGVMMDDSRYEVSGLNEDYDETFFATGGLERLGRAIQDQNYALISIDSRVRWAAPILRPSKIVCIGLNYKDHAEETHATPPPEPVVFLKSTTSIIGPYDPIMIPKNSVKTDWEVELGLVIGKKASYVEEKDAYSYIAGYILHNDVSEREFQLERSGTWDKGKGCDTFAPLGPYIITPDEIPDPHKLRIWLKLNGKMVQDGTTANLIFNIPFLISYVSQFMTLLPGDIISTGTPAGVGLGMKPPLYLKPGDTVELGVDHLGISLQEVIAYSRK